MMVVWRQGRDGLMVESWWFDGEKWWLMIDGSTLVVVDIHYHSTITIIKDMVNHIYSQYAKIMAISYLLPFAKIW